MKHARVIDGVLALLDPQCVVPGIRKGFGYDPSHGGSFDSRCNWRKGHVLEIIIRALLENDIHGLEWSESAGRVRFGEKRPYTAITTRPSNALLDPSDQTGWKRGEVKAGCCRRLRDCRSDQCRAHEESVGEMHFASWGQGVLIGLMYNDDELGCDERCLKE